MPSGISLAHCSCMSSKDTARYRASPTLVLTEIACTQPPPSAVKRERQRREQEVQQREAQREAIRGMKMGARDRSYLVRDGEIDVLRNVHGGVEVCLPRCLPAKRLQSWSASSSSASWRRAAPALRQLRTLSCWSALSGSCRLVCLSTAVRIPHTGACAACSSRPKLQTHAVVMAHTGACAACRSRPQQTHAVACAESRRELRADDAKAAMGGDQHTQPSLRAQQDAAPKPSMAKAASLDTVAQSRSCVRRGQT